MKRKSKVPPRPEPVSGTIQIHVQLPSHLHESMKRIRQARHESEGTDVRLCRIYKEALEQYIAARPQQQLLTAKPKILKHTA